MSSSLSRNDNFVRGLVKNRIKAALGASSGNAEHHTD